jgi:hypothetical protein
MMLRVVVFEFLHSGAMETMQMTRSRFIWKVCKFCFMRQYQLLCASALPSLMGPAVRYSDILELKRPVTAGSSVTASSARYVGTASRGGRAGDMMFGSSSPSVSKLRCGAAIASRALDAHAHDI